MWGMYRYYERFPDFRPGDYNSVAVRGAVQGNAALRAACVGCHTGPYCSNTLNRYVTGSRRHDVLLNGSPRDPLPANTTMGEHMRYNGYALMKGGAMFGRERVAGCLMTCLRFWYPGGKLTGFRTGEKDTDDPDGSESEGGSVGSQASQAMSMGSNQSQDLLGSDDDGGAAGAAAAAFAAISDDEDGEDEDEMNNRCCLS